MPRVAGQIDRGKQEAILDAAFALFAGRGVAASLEDVARSAGVSKQTIYNHWGGKAGLVRAIMERRVAILTAPLRQAEAGGPPEDALTAFGRSLLISATSDASTHAIRMAVQSAPEAPEIGRIVYESGVVGSRLVLAEFLRGEHAAGRLNVPDAREAAEFFAGMVVHGVQMPALLAEAPELTDAQIDATAREAAARFVRAYAP